MRRAMSRVFDGRDEPDRRAAAGASERLDLEDAL
jgi:hypothetical protein